MIGRPSTYTDEMATDICSKIVDGESLRAICLDGGMPGRRTVFQWLAKNKDFAHQYACAREEQADKLFDEILEIADGTTNDRESVQAARLRIDVRKWMAGKLRPKKYGDKYVSEISGADGGPIEVAETPASERLKAFLKSIKPPTVETE